MFVTFGLAYAAVRTLPDRLKRLALSGAFGCLLFFTVSNPPRANVGTGVTSASDVDLRLASQVNPRVVDALRGRGVVAVGQGAFGMYPVSASAVLALNDAGIPVCVQNIPQFEPSPIPECARHPDCDGLPCEVRPGDVADDSLLNPPGGFITTRDGRQRFAVIVHTAERIVQAHPCCPAAVAPLQITGVSRNELARWADLIERNLRKTAPVLIRHDG